MPPDRVLKRQKPEEELVLEKHMTRSSDYYDEEGDLEIISSDKVIFKFPAFYLQASSPIFRDMIKLGQTHVNQAIELTDAEFEDSATICAVMGIMIDNETILDLPVAQRSEVFRFLQKYEMERELKAIQVQLRFGDIKADDAMHTFLLGYRFNDVHLCAAMIRKHGDYVVEPAVADAQFGDPSARYTMFDISSFSLEEYAKLPAELSWALLRASQGVEFDTDFVSDVGKLADAFERIMTMPGAPRSS